MIRPRSTIDPKGIRASLAFRWRVQQFRLGDFLNPFDSFMGKFGISRALLDAYKIAAQLLGDGARRAGAEEGIEDKIARLRRGQDDPVKKGFRLLGGVQLPAILA